MDGTTIYPKTTSTKLPLSREPFNIMCSNPEMSDTTTRSPYQYNFDYKYINPFTNPAILSTFFYLPIINFTISRTDNDNEVFITLSDLFINTLLVYYPSDEYRSMSIANNDSQFTVRCNCLTSLSFILSDIAPNVMYNFCISPFSTAISPFECKPFMINTKNPWLLEEHKTIIFTTLSLILVSMLIIGMIITYCVIRQVPTLIKGSKRVVLVNNRGSNDVMIMPRNSTQSCTQSISSSCRKDSATVTDNEPPTYLTPLPRQSIDQRWVNIFIYNSFPNNTKFIRQPSDEQEKFFATWPP